jgi:uncharacterized protein (DUF849 family)
MFTIHSSDYSRRAFLALAGAGVVSLGGCAATHIHVRDSEANESLRSEDIATVLNAGRSTIPSIPIGISTHFGIIGDAEQRHEIVSMWSVLPDFASVNFNERGAVALAQLLIEKGVGVEAGLFNADAAGVDRPRLLHGFRATAWPLIEEATRRGYAT